MEIKLRPYQQETYDKIITEVNRTDIKKICVALPTGGGKSILIAKLANQLKGRTLILTHRIEILTQNSEWLKNASILTAKHNTLRYDCNIVIAMVQTTFARIKKYGTQYLGHFDNIILDEVQVLIFEKVFELYDYNKLIGFTGTPVLNKKIYTEIDDVEYVEDYTLSEIFDVLVQGTDTQDLIDLGFLVQDYNIVLTLPDFDKLKESESNPDGYTTKSLNDVYSNTASLGVLNKAYFNYCRGKKTIIFNATTKINEFVYNNFKKQGLNVKMFDSINQTETNEKTGKPYTRDEIIDWFNSERDAILINTNVFTTGFNVTDVEVVIVNRATKSLSLWIQMVGRGSRITDKIYKDLFTVIDLGQNIHEHGIWSKRRDWNEYFYSSGKRPKYKYDLLDTWDCHRCGAINIKGVLICEICGAPKLIIPAGEKENKKKLKDGELEVVQKMPPPKASTIISYTRARNENANFAFMLLERKILDLFDHYNVSKKFYYNRKDEFDKRVKDIYRPIYFAIIRSDLDGSHKKLDTQFERVLTKIKQKYENAS
jgi:superfamily II DNA or RNA helicase